jgi:hypothetical protein
VVESEGKLQDEVTKVRKHVLVTVLAQKCVSTSRKFLSFEGTVSTEHRQLTRKKFDQ